MTSGDATGPVPSPFQARLELVPITFAQAAEWNAEHHRHHPDATGHKFSIGVATDSPDGELLKLRSRRSPRGRGGVERTLWEATA